MAAFDLCITGGTLVTPGGLVPRTLAIRGGRIAALLDPAKPVDADDRLDVTGKLVMPGLVDAHVHFREPGLTHKEGFETGSRAAVAGGVTTVMVMPTDNPLTVTPDDFEQKVSLASGKSYADFAIQAVIGADLSHVAALVGLGAISFELFLGEAGPSLVVPDSGHVSRALRLVAEAGSVAGVYGQDDGIIAAATAALDEAARRCRLSFFRSRPPLSEALGVARACILAREAGARIHVRQTSARVTAEILVDMRARYAGISAEVTPHNLLLTEDEIERQGPWAKVSPPLRTADDVAAMWAALRAGTVDIVATDHAPHLPAEKEKGLEDIWAAPGGFPGVQTMLPLMLEATAAGRIGITDIVRVCSARPAQLFGLYPRKGAIDVGSDADIVIVDPDRSEFIRNEDQYSKAKITPFANRAVRGWPEMTLLRGRVVMRDGKVEGKPRGEFQRPSCLGGASW
jgi:dihydroorotase